MNARGDEGADWPFPRSVPSCISLHLKTCEEEETKKQRKVVLGVAVTLFYGDTQQQQQPQHHQQQQHRYGETRNPRRWRGCGPYSAQVPAWPQQAQVQTVRQCRSFKMPLRMLQELLL